MWVCGKRTKLPFSSNDVSINMDGLCGITSYSLQGLSFPTMVSVSEPSSALLFFGGEANAQVFDELWILGAGCLL